MPKVQKNEGDLKTLNFGLQWTPLIPGIYVARIDIREPYETPL